MTTFEEAKRCPKCGIPGEDVSTSPSKRPGTVIHSIACRNEQCVWFGEAPWLVQVNRDGSIPEPGRREVKLYPHLPNVEAAAKQVEAALEAQRLKEISGQGEVTNPRG